MSEQKHTETPWREQDRSNDSYPVSIYAEGRIVAYVLEHIGDKELARTNAAFIVRAVNSHDALVAVLKQIQEHVTEANLSDGVVFVDEVEVMNWCSDALKLAEGEGAETKPFRVQPHCVNHMIFREGCKDCHKLLERRGIGVRLKP